MSLRHTIKRALLRRGYDLRLVPPGNGDLLGYGAFEDMRRLSASSRPVVFDVGANVGQSIQQFREYFRNAEIHAFEPGEKAFRELAKNTQGLAGVHIVNGGLGSRRETKTYVENELSDMSSFLEPDEDAWGSITGRHALQLDTVDDYSNRNGIEHLDILKIDTQGYELEVLRGAAEMLRDRKIRLIYLEVTFARMYQGSPRFDELFAYLADNGMALVSFYEKHYKNDLLAWTDALFRLKKPDADL